MSLRMKFGMIFRAAIRITLRMRFKTFRMKLIKAYSMRLSLK